MKKILVISFSQSGQLTEILNNFLIPFKGQDIDFVKLEPLTPFPFPWDNTSFYAAMPESVLEEPIELYPPRFKHEHYDLIVFGYQPWFLSPSLPTTSILKNDYFKGLLNRTPIITVIGARNMWLNAQESVKALINDAGGILVGNIPLIDKTFNLISVITIFHWMSTGRKERKWGVLPLPGVSEEDINETSVFGEIVFKALANNDYDHLQNNIVKLNKIRINTSLMFIESRAKILFRIWAKTIKKKGTTPEKRIKWLRLFERYLLFALYFVSPIVLTVYTLVFRPFSTGIIKKKKEYFYNVKLN
ncbi:MAG: hypothetical protein HOK72_11760 [Flavobacteriales bacterium]|jgi:hypothetical protein|nr:hypothetical protein [Flavobacteriales bacterium]